MNEFLYNTMYRVSGEIKKLEAEIEFNNKNIVIIGDEHDIAYHLCGTFCMLSGATADINVHLVLDKMANNDILFDDFKSTFENVHIWNSFDEYVSARDGKDDIILDIVNLRAPVYAESGDARDNAYAKEMQTLSAIIDYNRQNKGNILQLITCVPSIDEPLPDIVHAIAEREYEVVFRDKADDSAEKFVIALEDKIRSCDDMLDRVQVIRLDRVFGPGIYGDDGACLYDLFCDFRDGKVLTVYDGDRFDFFSVAYVCDAMLTIILAIATGRKGNIYNVSSWEMTRYQAISLIFDTFLDKNVQIETQHDDIDYKPTYRMLNSKKSELVHYKNISKLIRTDKALAFQDTGYWFTDETDYIPKSDINVYYGRMDRIREIELEILKEVDKICKDNDIPYFLAAGTMLGAVRHKGFIPWDDDVDIGMLPEDYERFLKVCPDSLSVEIGYQSALNTADCHYIHDKIRLKNSFFSTKYSDRYNMLNGVYIDVFVYYKTANSPRAQQRHIKQVRRWRNLLGIRWADRKYQKGRFYSLCWDITHRINGDFFDKKYRKVCMKYDKKNTKYRVDGGFNLEKAGAVPDEWFHGTVDATFCGYTFPILKRSDDFLTHWYSSHYMELLPVDGRKSVHDVVRIDIGQNLFDETKNDARFRDVDLRGELYEIYK